MYSLLFAGCVLILAVLAIINISNKKIAIILTIILGVLIIAALVFIRNIVHNFAP
jgi:hypothetical protein